MSFEQFATAYWVKVASPLVVMAVIMGLDLFFGVIVALKAGSFTWTKIGDFASTNLPKTLGWLAVELISALPTEYLSSTPWDERAAMGVYAFVMAGFTGSLLGHLAYLGAWMEDGETRFGLQATQPEK